MSDIEIARNAKLEDIRNIAKEMRIKWRRDWELWKI